MVRFLAFVDRAIIILLLFFSILGFCFNKHLLLGTNSYHSFFIGIATGLSMALIGYFMLLKIKLWERSVSYLVGSPLLKGNLMILFFLSLMAGFWEELYARGFLLLISDSSILNLGFWLISLFVNLFWALSHLLNNYNDLLNSGFKYVFNNSLPHIIVIFLSGIPFILLTLYCKSLIVAMIAHFTLDFTFGIFYRKYISKNLTLVVNK